jgi:hypothetical protein
MASLHDIPTPDPVRREAGRRLMMAEVEQAQQARALAGAHRRRFLSGLVLPGNRRNGTSLKRSSQMNVSIRTATIIALIVTAISGATGGVALAADGAAPGEMLYGMDRSIESVRYNLASDSGKLALGARFAAERLEEAGRLETKGDDIHKTEALLAFDEAIAALETLLADGTLSAEVRAGIQTQLDSLLALRARYGSALVEVEIETEDGMTSVEVELEDAGSGTPVPAGGEADFVGVLDAMDSASVTVSGQVYALAPGAEIKAGVAVGEMVKIHLTTLADGSAAVREIELAVAADGIPVPGGSATPAPTASVTPVPASHEVEITGTLQALTATTATIDGQVYTLAAGAEIKIGVSVGVTVKAHVMTLADGTTAIREIELISGITGGSDSSGADDYDDDGDDHDDDDDDDDHDDDDDDD